MRLVPHRERACRSALLTVLLAVADAAAAPSAPPAVPEGEAIARQVCSTCHAFPPPDILPRGKWNSKIFEMTGLAVTGTGAPQGKEIPLDYAIEKILAYYEGAAPPELPPPAAWPEPSNAPVAFARHSLGFPGTSVLPIIANVRLFTMKPERGVEVFTADMSNGLILRGAPAKPAAGLEVVARVPNPCHTEAVDLDRDGTLDLVVANLGGVTPGDHKRGSVVWLRGMADGTFEPRTLASGLPRVADVQAADFDQDGDLDLVVAAFGWREVGSTLLLENRTTDWSKPEFVSREIDWRQGPIHVPVADLDKDGKSDFVNLISQHHETVVAFLNRGKNAFAPKTIYAAPHPGWGTSGLALTDLDKDGDEDVLLTNGDMFDEFLLKPYHGIAWLENRGTFPFTAHTLAPLSGVHRAQAVDLDLDGDLDIVACTLIPGMAKYGKALPSLVWLEQVAPGRFERRTLEKGGYHASLDSADIDRDGDI
ncbi:MAG TPA: VCBS repeat-containing protein, partial [Vicinamibacteria bacterium]